MIFIYVIYHVFILSKFAKNFLNDFFLFWLQPLVVVQFTSFSSSATHDFLFEPQKNPI